MSKIEKALRKAKSNGALRVVSSNGVATASRATDSVQTESRSLVATPAEREDQGERSGAAIAIAKMQEPSTLARGELDQRRIIYPEMGDQDVVQAFRQIRTRIIQRTQARNAVIMVTSVVPGGGSSFLAKNLGVAFAFDAGKTALVIDCNLRRPSMNRLFGDAAVRGLTDFLEHPEIDVAEIIHPVGVERLRVIPAGAAREIPAEYFTSVKMRQFVDAVKRRYRERFIILDAPPMTEAADTQILAELCDLVVLVAPYARVTESQLDVCVKAIDKDKFFGVVFNGEPQVPKFHWKAVLGEPFASIKRRVVDSGRALYDRVMRRIVGK